MSLEAQINARGIPMRVSLAQAQEIIATALMPLRVAFEIVSLDAALGRYLGEDVHIGHALPPFAASAMDGYALRHADLKVGSEFQCVGESRAGAAFAGTWQAATCVRISTGAPLPAGFDTVVIQENVDRSGAQVRVLEAPAAGANVRPAGDECVAGTRLLARGERLCARRLALIATAGLARVRVHVAPRVAVVSTGDELIAPGRTLGADQIFESNGAMLRALVVGAGGVAIAAPRVADDPEALRSALDRLRSAADLILTTGGASVGEHDHLPALLLREGGLHFWKVRIKPGMPAALGEFQGTPLLALPGNPVSAYITFLKLAVPAMRALSGLTLSVPVPWRGRLTQALHKRHARAEFLRARHHFDESGQLWIEPIGTPDSHRIQALTAASVLLSMPEGEVHWEAGRVVTAEPIGECT